jgi:hypothetical protein
MSNHLQSRAQTRARRAGEFGGADSQSFFARGLVFGNKMTAVLESIYGSHL